MREILQVVTFYVLAGITISSALVVVTGKNLFRNGLSLSLFFLSVAGIYFLLNAEFIGVAQIFVYIGGIIVLLLFGIMLTAHIADPTVKQTNEQKGIASLTGIILVCLLVFVLTSTFFPVVKHIPHQVSTSILAKIIFTDYVFILGLIFLLFLVGIIGALILTKEDGSTGSPS